MEAKRVIYRALNRRGTRGILALLGSAIKTLQYRRFCRVRYADGRWLHFHPDGVLVEREIHLAKISELDSMTRDYWFHGYTPRAGDVVIDVGAGSGWETRMLSQLVGDRGRVIAIEAHPATFACLQETVRLNGLRNVTAICCAAGDREGSIEISDQTTHQGNTIVTGGGGLKISMRTLEEICAAEGISHIAFLKMNIEGAERVAVPGLGGMASRTDHVAISCHDFKADYGQGEDFRTKAAVSECLTKFGFQISTRNDSREWVRDYVYGRR